MELCVRVAALGSILGFCHTSLAQSPRGVGYCTSQQVQEHAWACAHASCTDLVHEDVHAGIGGVCLCMDSACANATGMSCILSGDGAWGVCMGRHTRMSCVHVCVNAQTVHRAQVCRDHQE